MEEFIESINKVISGELETTTSKILISPHKIDEYLKSNDFEQGDFDSNGWDWDFWRYYLKGENTYILSGSGWYNGGLTFSKAE